MPAPTTTEAQGPGSHAILGSGWKQPGPEGEVILAVSEPSMVASDVQSRPMNTDTHTVLHCWQRHHYE